MYLVVENNSIKAFCISDSHFGRPDKDFISPQRLDEIIGTLAKDADIFVYAGDIFHRGVPGDHNDIIQILSRPIIKKEGTKVPKLIQLGNHDISEFEEEFRQKLRQIDDIFLLDEQEKPFYYITENHKKIAFVGALGISSGYAKPIKDTPFTNKYIEKKASNEIDKLHSTLNGVSADSLIGIFHYAPRLTLKCNIPEGDKKLERLIDDYEFDLALHGHVHPPNTIHRTAGGVLLENITASACKKINGIDHKIIDLPTSPTLLELAS